MHGLHHGTIYFEEFSISLRFLNFPLNTRTMRILLLIFFYTLQYLPIVHSQVNFRNELEISNPIPKDSDLSLEEKLVIHQTFLSDARQEKSQKKELFANLHIFLDYIRMEDFTEAAVYLLEAEEIAKASENVGWIGWVNYRSGLLYGRIRQQEKAIEHYLVSAELCAAAGDSLCLGESLEQLGAFNGVLDNYEEAETYFSQAVPLLKKYGKEKNVATLLGNYGSLLSMSGKTLKAVPVLKEGIEIKLKIKKYRGVAIAMNNLANAYYRLGRYDESIKQYEEALKLNEERGFAGNMITNYLGMHIVYDEKKDYQTSMDFLMKYNQLKDSLIGQETQLTIANLEKQYENKSNELELAKTESKLLATQRSLERNAWFFLLSFLLFVIGVWYFKAKSLRAKSQKEAAEKDLKKLTKILIDKNSAILSLNDQLAQSSNTEVETEDLDIFINTSILTDEEWVTYKSNFEKVFPGYLSKLRADYSSLSDAEERLFLFIKLQLKSREIAAILGISVNSVKKTRQRLRKRLQIEKEISLEDFVKNY